MSRNPYEAPTDDDPVSERGASGLGWLLFSFRGRVRRLDYWKGVGINYGLVLGVVFLVSVLDSDLFAFVGYVAMIPFLWMMLAVQVKRWHDRNKSGWWVFIGLVPYIGGIWQLVECGCLEGTAGSNRFGADPKRRDWS